jgi:hypothetical protein
MAFPLDRQQGLALGIGLGVVAAGLGIYFYAQRSAHLDLAGSILKVRTHATDETGCVAILDFRITNTSDYPWIVKNVEVSADIAEGTIDAATAAESDSRRIFEIFPLLGQRFNEAIKQKDRIEPHQTVDRMVAVRFEAPESRITGRKRMTLRIVELDGAVSELH